MKEVAQELVVEPVTDPIDVILGALPMEVSFPCLPYILLTYTIGLKHDEQKEDDLGVVSHVTSIISHQRTFQATVMTTAVALPELEIAEICRRYHVRGLSLFGSAVLRSDQRPLVRSTNSSTESPASRMIARSVPFGTLFAKCTGIVSARWSSARNIVK
jgi:hypothetical protein